MDDEDNHRQVPLLRRRGFVFDRELLSVSILSSDVSMASRDFAGNAPINARHPELYRRLLFRQRGRRFSISKARPALPIFIRCHSRFRISRIELVYSLPPHIYKVIRS
jgi:hypothetical protein